MVYCIDERRGVGSGHEGRRDRVGDGLEIFMV